LRKRTIEDYLELIFNLQKDRKKVHTKDISNILQISPPSVTEMFQKLDDRRYIRYKKYEGATLTRKGERLAKQTKMHHEVLKEFLILLGIDKKIAETDACEMEHVLHPSTLEMIVKFVKTISQCKMKPLWLQRLSHYEKTGNLLKCPKKLENVCIRYSNHVPIDSGNAK
jgi:DtxR family Mn-dependent transcriptional regulator